MRARVTVRIERALLDDVDRAARARDLSRNDYLVFSAAHCVGRDTAAADAVPLELIGNLHRDIKRANARIDELEARLDNDR